MSATELLNFTSLALGLLAWAAPVAGMLRRKSEVLWPVLSGGACAAALYLQIGQLSRWVEAENWGTLMDVGSGLAIVAGWLVVR